MPSVQCFCPVCSVQRPVSSPVLCYYPKFGLLPLLRFSAHNIPWMVSAPQKQHFQKNARPLSRGGWFLLLKIKISPSPFSDFSDLLDFASFSSLSDAFLCVPVYLHVCVCACVFTFSYMYMYLMYAGVCMGACVWVCVSVSVSGCIWVYMFVCSVPSVQCPSV